MDMDHPTAGPSLYDRIIIMMIASSSISWMYMYILYFGWLGEGWIDIAHTNILQIGFLKAWNYKDFFTHHHWGGLSIWLVQINLNHSQMMKILAGFYQPRSISGFGGCQDVSLLLLVHISSYGYYEPFNFLSCEFTWGQSSKSKLTSYNK